MKYMLIFCTLMAGVFTFHEYGYGLTRDASSQLIEIVDVMNKHDIQVDTWSLYNREMQTIDRTFEESIEALKESKDGFTWSIDKNDHQWKFVGKKTSKTIQESIVFAYYPHKKQANSYLIYKVNGEKWDLKTWKNFYPAYQKANSDLFINQPKSFACATGQTSDKIEGVLHKHAKMLVGEFSATPIESLDEETFVSVSAYTEKWKNNIPTKTNEMNLQIALRNQGLGGTTAVAIGTPIITSEY